MPDDRPLLPPGCVLLHIGPPKTGTTALQSALSRARPVMAGLGVTYPGSGFNHSLAARAVLGALAFKTHPPGDPAAWARLLGQVSAVPDRRVIVSSEFFSNADDAGAHRIASGFRGRTLHVVITLRSLAKVLPSNWQQNVRTDLLRMSYEEWLVAHLGRPPYGNGPPAFRDSYWQDRRRDDVLVDRWISVVGADNVTVVVVDESDPLLLLRTTEEAVGLPRGLLKPAKTTNGSLPFGEVEMLRALNEQFHRRGWSSERHRRLYREGPLGELQRPDREVLRDQPVTTPTWAAERIAEIGTAAAERIAVSGARVVGDIASLGSSGCDNRPGDDPAPVVSSQVVAAVVVGTVLAAAGGHTSSDSRPGPAAHGRARTALAQRRGGS